MKKVMYLILLSTLPILTYAQIDVVAPSGNVGIGEINPDSKLTVRTSGSEKGISSYSDHGNTHLPWSDGRNYISGKGVIFRTGNTERMRIADNGNVGIGTNSPTYKLQTNGDIYANGGWFRVSGNKGLYFQSYGGGFWMTNNVWIRTYGSKGFYHNKNMRTDGTFQVGPTGNRLLVNTDGKVGIGTGNSINANVLLHVNGSIGYVGTSTNISDRRLKQNGNKFDYGLDEILKLSPIYYNYNGKAGINPEQTHVGIYAQDLKKAAPKLVGEYTYQETKTIYEGEGEEKMEFKEKTGASETYLTINESAIKYMLINAVKEQQEIITTLEERITQMEALLNNNAELPKVSKTIELGASGQLLQNQPNPFNETTTIKYTLPKNSKYAVMQITDMMGKVLKIVQLSDIRNGELVIEARELSAGTYTYTLFVDGQIIDTKKMVLTR